MDNSEPHLNSHNATASLTAAKNIASNTAANIKRELQKGVEEVGSVVKDVYGDASHQLSDVKSAAMEKATAGAKDAARGIEEEFRKSPILTIAVAFGMGALASHLMRRG